MVGSLLDMATRACIQYVDGLEDVGDYPYSIMRPILRKIKTPSQLQAIEENSPHIAEEDAELWKAFIKRDIPNGESKIPANIPSDPTKWSKVYRKLKREDQRKQDAAEEMLRAALSKKSAEKAGKTTQFVHAVIAEKKKPVWGAPRAAPSGSQALKNARTTADRLTILKRQTANRQAGRTVTQSMPSHELQQKRSVVQQAPRSMVNQYNRTTTNVSAPVQSRIQQRDTSPARHARIFTSQRGPVSDQDRAINAAIRQEREEKERRLRALTGATKSTAAAAPPPQRVAAQPGRPAAPVTSRMIPPPAKPAVAASVRSVPPPVKHADPVASRTGLASSSSPSAQSKPAATAVPAAPTQPPSSAPPPQSAPKRRYKYDPFLPAKKRKT